MTTSLNLVGNSTGKSAGFVPYSSNNALNTRPQVSVFGYVGTDSRKVGHLWQGLLYGKGWEHRDRTRRGPLSFHGRRPNVNVIVCNEGQGGSCAKLRTIIPDLT